MFLKPLKTSLTVAFCYILVCSLYIWLSGILAVKMASSVSVLQSIELYKGIAFVIITGFVSFVFTYQLLIRIKNQNRELELQRKALIDAQASALTGTFAAGIAHDINNVLGAVDFGMSELEDYIPHEKRGEIDRIGKAYTMIREMANRLQKIGKSRTELDMKEVEISGFVKSTVDFAKRHKKIKTCNVQFIEKGTNTLRINPFLLEQMIINLVLNAAEATETIGKIEVRVLNDEKQSVIEVHDNGPGIDPSIRENLFNPYHTTKPDGTGLGLATVKICAEIHGGHIVIDKSDLGGALFRIVLPINK